MTTDLFYFSGTGNSLFIAKTIKESLESDDAEHVTIEPMTANGQARTVHSDADRIGFIYPTYDLSAPEVVRAFSKNFSANEDSYIFIYANSAGFPGVSADMVRKILEANNLHVANAFHAPYPDNSGASPINRDKLSDLLDQAKKTHIKDSEAIRTKIQNKDNPLLNANRLKYVMAKGADLYYQNIIGFKDIRVDESTCNGCGTCSKLCPMQNITMDGKNGKTPTFNDKCEMCMACVNVCPKQSLRYRLMKKRADYQYRHPNIQLKEILLNLDTVYKNGELV